MSVHGYPPQVRTSTLVEADGEIIRFLEQSANRIEGLQVEVFGLLDSDLAIAAIQNDVERRNQEAPTSTARLIPSHEVAKVEKALKNGGAVLRITQTLDNNRYPEIPISPKVIASTAE